MYPNATCALLFHHFCSLGWQNRNSIWSTLYWNTATLSPKNKKVAKTLSDRFPWFCTFFPLQEIGTNLYKVSRYPNYDIIYRNSSFFLLIAPRIAPSKFRLFNPSFFCYLVSSKGLPKFFSISFFGKESFFIKKVSYPENKFIIWKFQIRFTGCWKIRKT